MEARVEPEKDEQQQEMSEESEQTFPYSRWLSISLTWLFALRPIMEMYVIFYFSHSLDADNGLCSSDQIENLVGD